VGISDTTESASGAELTLNTLKQAANNVVPFQAAPKLGISERTLNDQNCSTEEAPLFEKDIGRVRSHSQDVDSDEE
jgi:hypothetical protein